MNDNLEPPRAQIGPFTRFCIRLAGGDVETARRCPPSDLEVFRILALIMLAMAAYQTAILSLIGHRVFSPDGQVSPVIVLVAGLIAAFVMGIDSFSFMRAGWVGAGEKDLARAGLDLRSGWPQQFKVAIAVTVRLVLAIGLAELLAIFLALIIFSADISARLNDRFTRANAAILGTVTKLVDEEIKRGEAAAAAQSIRVAGLTTGVRGLRDSLGDSSTNPRVIAAQGEVDRASAAMTKADEDLRAAEGFAAAELSGVKGPGYSGQPGRGPQRRAAEERIASAKSRLSSTERDLEAARTRLETARSEVSTSNEAVRTRAAGDLPHLETELATEDAKLAAARTHLADLVANRGRAIRRGIESTPEHVPYESGLIAQIRTLDQIADGDRKIQALILLMALVGFGFEMAAVLAKLTTHVPTVFAALTVRDHYMATVQIVDDMAAELDRRAAARQGKSEEPDGLGIEIPLSVDVPPPSNDNPFAAASIEIPPIADELRTSEEPQKRKRGRPRKQSLH